MHDAAGVGQDNVSFDRKDSRKVYRNLTTRAITVFCRLLIGGLIALSGCCGCPSGYGS